MLKEFSFHHSRFIVCPGTGGTELDGRVFVAMLKEYLISACPDIVMGPACLPGTYRQPWGRGDPTRPGEHTRPGATACRRPFGQLSAKWQANAPAFHSYNKFQFLSFRRGSLSPAIISDSTPENHIVIYMLIVRHEEHREEIALCSPFRARPCQVEISCRAGFYLADSRLRQATENVCWNNISTFLPIRRTRLDAGAFGPRFAVHRFCTADGAEISSNRLGSAFCSKHMGSKLRSVGRPRESDYLWRFHAHFPQMGSWRSIGLLFKTLSVSSERASDSSRRGWPGDSADAARTGRPARCRFREQDAVSVLLPRLHLRFVEVETHRLSLLLYWDIRRTSPASAAELPSSPNKSLKSVLFSPISPLLSSTQSPESEASLPQELLGNELQRHLSRAISIKGNAFSNIWFSPLPFLTQQPVNTHFCRSWHSQMLDIYQHRFAFHASSAFARHESSPAPAF